MISEFINTNKKQSYFKVYPDLMQLDKAIELIKKDASANQVSILGKVSRFYEDSVNGVLKDIHSIKAHWEKIFSHTLDFGSFDNPEFGTVFIAGPLTSMFLHKINGKNIAMLSAGPYAIIRGIGASQKQATHYLKLMQSGGYLLIFRGFEGDLNNLQILLG